MNKRLIMFFMAIFSLIGSYIPVLLSDSGVFSAWSILGSVIGGLFGIWLGVVASRRWG